MGSDRLRAAVVGVGYLGRFHAQKYAALDDVDLVAVCDTDADTARRVAAEVGSGVVESAEALIGQVDAVTIAASTSAHYALAKTFLEAGIHVLVEKPLTRTSAEAGELVVIARDKNLKFQVGHIERFNPALVCARERLDEVRFIECHRLAPFKARGVDVDVVLDLMIHDLDVLLSLVDSEPASVSAVGIPVLTQKADIANARIEFANGAIANVTASRVSTSAQRKFRVFQRNQYVSIDFGKGEVQRVTSRADMPAEQSAFEIDEWSLDRGDALLAETRAFVDSIVNDTPCAVTGAEGLAALELAEAIVGKIEQRWRTDPDRPRG